MSNDQLPTTDDKAYPYKGVPLTAAIAKELIRKYFAGRLVERHVLDDEVLRAHLAGGGLNPSSQLTNVIRKALGDMKTVGMAENTALGYWRIQQDESVFSDQMLLSEESAVESSPSAQPLSSEPIADIDIGTGTGAIYVYYFPTYRLRAEEHGETIWPCKIGRTDGDPLLRVLSQVATALPEKPHIALVLRTSQPSAWESALHGVLTLRGLQLEDSPGVEWFLTSPEDILELVRSIDPKLRANSSLIYGKKQVHLSA
jgi:hypothetical protein